MENKKAICRRAMDALFKNYDESAVRDCLTEEYIQHNPQVTSGREAIIGMLPEMAHENGMF